MEQLEKIYQIINELKNDIKNENHLLPTILYKIELEKKEQIRGYVFMQNFKQVDA